MKSPLKLLMSFKRNLTCSLLFIFMTSIGFVSIASGCEPKPPTSVAKSTVASSTKDKPEDKKAAQIKQIFGWREYARLENIEASLIAKLDTGAKTSSLHAEDIEIFEKNGEEWVRFSFYWTKNKNTKKLQPVKFERPLVREVAIKTHKHKSSRRPIIKMFLTLAQKKYCVEFTLVSRHKFNYPILLGRKFIAEAGIINPDESYLVGKPVIDKSY